LARADPQKRNGFFGEVGKKMRLVAPKRKFGETWSRRGSPKRSPGMADVLPRSVSFAALRGYVPLQARRQSITSTPPRRRRAIGIRPCDVITAVPGEVLHQRSRTLLQGEAGKYRAVQLVCNTPPRKVFCICCDSASSDVYTTQLTDLGDRSLYEVGSDRARGYGAAVQMLTEAGGATSPAEKDRAQADSLSDDGLLQRQSTTYPRRGSGRGPGRIIRPASGARRARTCAPSAPAPWTNGPGGRLFQMQVDSCQFAGSRGGQLATKTDVRQPRRQVLPQDKHHVQRDGKHGCAVRRCVSACLTS
jgi:hypothetical protein